MTDEPDSTPEQPEETPDESGEPDSAEPGESDDPFAGNPLEEMLKMLGGSGMFGSPPPGTPPGDTQGFH